MKRVMIIGCPGSGKSTAAKRLAQITNLPLIHLDLYYWQLGWKRPDKDAWNKTIKDLVEQSQWIMDGNYAGTLEHRLARADTVIHLDLSTYICASRMLRRMITGLGKRRGEEFGDGCVERLDWPFFWFVLNYRRTRRARDLEKLSNFSGEMYRFNNSKTFDSFIQSLLKQNGEP